MAKKKVAKKKTTKKLRLAPTMQSNSKRSSSGRTATVHGRVRMAVKEALVKKAVLDGVSEASALNSILEKALIK